MRDKILHYLNELFDVQNFDEKYAANGLQVEGKEDVKKIGFAVDASLKSIQKAVAQNCDMLITHHGLFWPALTCIKGVDAKRMELLFDHNVSLVGIHLPLDKHAEVGNNVTLISLLGGRVKEEFGKCSYVGDFGAPKTVEEIKTLLDEKLETHSKIFKFGPENVERFGVCSGSGTGEFAALPDVDLFITGEFSYQIYNTALEQGTNIITTGHYASEVPGLKELMKKMKKDLGVEVVFIESKVDY